MPSNNERYPLSHEFLSIASILNKICFRKLKSIEFENRLLIVKRLISEVTNSTSSEVYVDHEEYNSSKPEEITNNSSLSSTLENIDLNKLLLDLGIKQGDSNESTWENINTRLHMIFGYTNQLKTPINDKNKYLQLIHALKHSKFMNKCSFNFENRLDFGNNIKSISEGFTKWNEIELLAKRVSEEVTHFRLNHFLKLIDGYLALFKFASQETPEKYKNYNNDQKIENGIALSRDKSSHLKLKWVKFHIRKFLETGTRTENKMYNALWHIKFIVDNQIKTTKELAKAGGSPRFFQNLSNDKFNHFLFEITGGKLKQFSVLDEINENSIFNIQALVTE
ncbi:hypothetical protein F8M41_010849 [Gigaspora margarita]|uniref:Uncharacterized protein n=1 Tax=Gigaspora margarita TaxID=4874 RepID=A0A8H4A217_GIGMA|nr:hypothetical protein F8M41_010849 [Gigaspora margarita]